jgi:hypothetical protein
MKKFYPLIVYGFMTVIFKPVVLPFKLLGFVGSTTAKVASGGAKLGLRNVSVQAGFVKVRPFDFR